VEGVRTAEAVNNMALKLNIELPLMQSVYRVLTGKLDIQDGILQLMARPERTEI
jgi:glycerol-3-phosphate dehydrogenase (NAD(P)+)